MLETIHDYRQKCELNPPDIYDEVWVKNIKEVYNQIMPLAIPSNLVPDRSGVGVQSDRKNLLASTNILTKLKKLEKKIDNLEQFYSLLSEFVHPNGFPFLNNTSTVYRPILNYNKSKIANLPDYDVVLHFGIGNAEENLEPYERTFRGNINIIRSSIVLVEKWHHNLAEITAAEIKNIKKQLKNKKIKSLVPRKSLNMLCICGCYKKFRMCCGK